MAHLWDSRLNDLGFCVIILCPEVDQRPLTPVTTTIIRMAIMRLYATCGHDTPTVVLIVSSVRARATA